MSRDVRKQNGIYCAVAVEVRRKMNKSSSADDLNAAGSGKYHVYMLFREEERLKS